jgi:restriction system protein
MLSSNEQNALMRDRDAVVRLVAERSHSAEQSMPVFTAFKQDMTPADSEMFCAQRLRNSGWDSRVTVQSRDQGVDVIAEKKGMRVVLQCKLYSGAVGNKAVQEVAAGAAHEKTHFGAVVSNNRYTAPAEQLARTNGVLLLHYSDLENLDQYIARSVPMRALRSPM